MTKTPPISLPSNPTPTFAGSSELARYVRPEDLKKSHRVSSAAFLPASNDTHLSVNSLELESPQDIAVYYRERFQSGIGTIAIACRKVNDYNTAASSAGVTIHYDRSESKWKYHTDQGLSDAYKHRPIPRRSHSHCGVEYISNQLAYLKQKQIARRLRGKRAHLFKGNN
jgi:hypothetical protein